MTMASPDMDVIKEIPGYKVILKAVLKSQIQQLVSNTNIVIKYSILYLLLNIHLYFLFFLRIFSFLTVLRFSLDLHIIVFA